MHKNKLLFCALGLFFPGTGFNVFYLKGLGSPWAWLQMFSLFAGILGWMLLGASDMSSALGWIFVAAGFIALEASWLTTIVYGLRPDERWDAQFNANSGQKSASGWLVILCVIASLMIGAAILMIGLAIAFEQHFLSQFEAAKKISQ
jgi:TM2 domain-containing membrane protein YozV